MGSDPGFFAAIPIWDATKPCKYRRYLNYLSILGKNGPPPISSYLGIQKKSKTTCPGKARQALIFLTGAAREIHWFKSPRFLLLPQQNQKGHRKRISLIRITFLAMKNFEEFLSLIAFFSQLFFDKFGCQKMHPNPLFPKPFWFIIPKKSDCGAISFWPKMELKISGSFRIQSPSAGCDSMFRWFLVGTGNE